jgi:hypothetical protein
MQGNHRSLFGRFRSWTHLHHAKTALLVVFGLIIITAFTVFIVLYQQPKPVAKLISAPVKVPTPSLKPIVYYSPLSGEAVPDEASTKQAVTAIMIENSPDARPQSGIKAAGVVFEAIAEGGITRFLTLFQQEKPALVGPVRSVRMYYVDWLAPFQASVAHVGGSAAALKEVRNGSYRDIDQFFNSATYYRATDRYAPHNVYTTFARLDALNVKKGYATSTFTAWPRKDGATAKTVAASTIDVTISGPLYNSHYQYDPTNNVYLRSEGGAAHKDRELGQISPSTVIVMDVSESTVLQDGYREQITTTGSGRVRVFQDGSVTEGTWSKADRGSQIKFTDGTGKEIPLNRGQTWITAVPANRGGKVVWK